MLSHVSNEYILTYFGEWELIFIGGIRAWIYWREWVEIFGEMNTPIPPGFAPLIIEYRY